MPSTLPALWAAQSGALGASESSRKGALGAQPASPCPGARSPPSSSAPGPAEPPTGLRGRKGLTQSLPILTHRLGPRCSQLHRGPRLGHSHETAASPSENSLPELTPPGGSTRPAR